MNDRSTEIADAGGEGRVLPFRPRTSASIMRAELKRPDDAAAAPDDFTHRMLVNAAGLACAVVLTSIGVWLAVTISDLRRTQDCVLTGQRNCAPVAALGQRSVPLRQH